MNIETLKSEVEKYRTSLKEKTGKLCNFSESGPVGMLLIDALVQTLEAQEARLVTLEQEFQQLGKSHT